MTTIEGLLRDIVVDLSTDQPLRRVTDPDTYEKLEALLTKLRESIGDSIEEEGEDKEKKPEAEVRPFTIQLDDPAGNSFIEFVDSMADPKWSMRQYNRTHDQNVLLGIAAAETQPDEGITAITEEVEDEDEPGRPGEEIFAFPGICSSCSSPLNTYMKKVIIPYFKVCAASFPAA